MLPKNYIRYLAGYDTKGLDVTNGSSKSCQDKGGLENKMFQQIMLDFLILVYATHISNTTCLIFHFDTMVSEHWIFCGFIFSFLFCLCAEIWPLCHLI